MQYRLPLGQKVYTALNSAGPVHAAEIARLSGDPNVFDRVSAVANEDPVPSFLHSALCAMSLPVRRPADDKLPIIRADGQYSLAITPKAVLQNVDGQRNLKILGVPYGSLPRVILIHIMTEAVRTRSRQVYLGKNFTDWMKRMGFRTVSYGPRGSATLVKDQLDRLFACEWMIRWDGTRTNGEQEYGIKEVKLTNEYSGVDGDHSSFSREIYLTEGFYDHLKDHAVPLNELAIRQLKDSATALDLYTWLAYRLPRINPSRPATLSWPQLANHFGNDGKNIRKFRQVIRDAWEKHVSAVYPQAKAEFDTGLIRLHSSPSPVPRKTVLNVVLPSGQPPTNTTAPQKRIGKTTEPRTAVVETENLTPDDALKARFFTYLKTRIGNAEMASWFAEACLKAPATDNADADEWLLSVPGEFQAKWISDHFMLAISAASHQAGLTESPRIVAAKTNETATPSRL
jgi:hypothetical protein